MPTYVDGATVIEDVDFDEASETVVVHVRPRRSTKRRCGRCGVRPQVYDQGEGRRNWRALDFGTLVGFLQADSPRVNCPTHRPTVAQCPGPATAPAHTRDFDDQCSWLVIGGLDHRPGGGRGRAAHDPFEGLIRIGLDEIR